MTDIYVKGLDPKDSTRNPDKKSESAYKAGGTITPGSLVMAATTDATGQTVIAATAAGFNLNNVLGIYSGFGGSSTPVSAAEAAGGLKGRTAVSGDEVVVVEKGIVTMRAAAQSVANMVTWGILLAAHGTTAGWVQESTAGSNKWQPMLLWQTVTGGGTTTGTELYIKAKIHFR